MSTVNVSFASERQELQALFESGFLDRDSNSGRLLEYLCQKHFDGTESDVKEANIAIDVFGRSTDFDRRRDSIVRVEASRLRKRLEEYYTSEGAGRPLRIVIPLGQYVPQFVRNGASTPAPVPVTLAPAVETAPSPAVPSGSARRFWLSVMALALLLVSTTVYLIALRRPAAGPPPAPPAVEAHEGVRILCGYDKPSHTDRQGRLWLGDRYFTGGYANRPAASYVARAEELALLQTRRVGERFSYRIPLKPGVYELRLHFVEQSFGPSLTGGGGEVSRVMAIRVNGQPLLPYFDPYADAGGDHIVTVRAFKDIRPASDGYLHLLFERIFDLAFVSAIEITPGIPGRIHPVRIVARETSYTDHSGQVWLPDRYVIGGKLVLRKEYIKGSGDADMYMGERFGRFNYSIPVPPGRYGVTLRFCEQWFKQPGQRVFDVYANGAALLRNFDIYREAGGALRPFDRTFHGIEANAQGKIDLSFLPVVNYASVNAIEVIDESR